jgi:hypothetical protein
MTYSGLATSFNLSGFSPGFETTLFSCVFHWDNDGGSNITTTEYLYSMWVGRDNNTIIVQGANALPFTFTLYASGGWQEYLYCCNVGVAPWEIDDDGNFYVKAATAGNYPIGMVSTTIAFSNVPDETLLGSTKPGYMWVEGNNLCYVNANQWKHTMVGTQVSTSPGTSKKGFMWIDTSNDLHWVGDNGYDYKCAWKVKQFDCSSWWSNSSHSEVYAGTDKAGYIWVDNEFGWTHLSYIGYDGYKYLTGAGDNPY